jgi:hypothetical protein
METFASVAFRHRHNQNGSWDSICLKCFRTAATSEKEEDLKWIEQSHNCAVPSEDMNDTLADLC